MRLNNKFALLIIVTLLSALALAIAPPPTPLGKAQAEVYKLEFTKFELQDDAGTWHVVNDEAAIVDIASVNGGDLAKAIAGAAASIPAGHYKAFRSEVSGTMTIKGFWEDTVNHKVYYTTSGTKPVSAPPGSPPGTPDGFGIVPGVFAGTSAQFVTAVGNGTVTDYAEGSIRPPTVPEVFYGGQGTEDITVGVGADTPVTEDLIVDLTDTIQVWDLMGADGVGDVIFPGQPSIILD